jgi:8-oxo-dGTP pyrophosphatase MutT (NUDIX family)
MIETPAAKIVLYSPTGVILPYGPSRRLNLPGGGLDKGELPIDGLAREMEEEIGLPLSETNPVWIGERAFHTTSRDGELQRRNWSIFAGTTEFSAEDLMFGDDIQGVVCLSSLELFRNRQANHSAKVAVAMADKAMRRFALR